MFLRGGCGCNVKMSTARDERAAGPRWKTGREGWRCGGRVAEKRKGAGSSEVLGGPYEGGFRKGEEGGSY